MKKIFILLPDGVGLRNFAFGDFHKEASYQGFDVTYWNNTSFPIKDLGHKELNLKIGKSRAISDLYKRAKIAIELKQNYKNFKDKAYLSYIFPSNYKGGKNYVKSTLVDLLVLFNNSSKGLTRVKDRLHKLERNSEYYLASKKTLIENNPDFLFLTNQRPINAIAPMLAAQDLGIPTATFIFSWDNLPKGTKVVDADYYFVWSEHMKQELLKYYPTVGEGQIKITGTPQFECHYNTQFEFKNTFFEKYNLDLNTKYICFSGDDVTTSPNDQFYLEDVAKAVKNLNKKGHKIGIVYRKCPVDFSDRHLAIYKEYKDLIKLIDPKWKNLGSSWNQVMPMPEDLELLANTVHHAEMVINVGSSMVFDNIAQNKPCAFLNYNTHKTVNSKWSIKPIYEYIHFQSMPNKNAVLWINTSKNIEEIIIKGLSGEIDLSYTKDWYNKVVNYPQQQGTKNIWYHINKITCT